MSDRTADANWTLADLRDANTKRQAEWCPDETQPDLSFRAMELAGETGEACNVAKKIVRERKGWRGSRATAADLATELADVVICADLAAMAEGIDLMQAVRDKFNATTTKVGLTTMLAAARSPAGGVTPYKFPFTTPVSIDVIEGECGRGPYQSYQLLDADGHTICDVFNSDLIGLEVDPGDDVTSPSQYDQVGYTNLSALACVINAISDSDPKDHFPQVCVALSAALHPAILPQGDDAAIYSVLAEAKLVLLEKPGEEDGPKSRLTYGMGIHDADGWTLYFHPTATRTEGAQAVAWMTDDGRVLNARQKDAFVGSGGASAYSMEVYNIPLYPHPAVVEKDAVMVPLEPTVAMVHALCEHAEGCHKCHESFDDKRRGKVYRSCYLFVKERYAAMLAAVSEGDKSPVSAAGDGA